MKHFYLIGLAIFVSFSSLYGNTISESKAYTKTFATNVNSTLEISNKYGDIELLTWDKDSIKFEVEVTAVTDDYSNTMDLLEAIKINFQSAGSFVIAETDWSEELNMFRKGWYELGQSFSGQDRITVNYKVHCPSNISVDLTNKFGSIFLGDHSGEMSIDLSHGDLRARNINNNRCKVAYGKVRVKEINGGRCEFSYLDHTQIEVLNKVRLKSNSSDIDVQEAIKIELDSRHDDISFEEVDQINIEASLSDIYIGDLEELIAFTGKFGSLNIDRIEASCESVVIKASSTDVNVKFAPTWKGGLEAELVSCKGHLLSHSELGESIGEELIDKTESIHCFFNGLTEVRAVINMKGGFLNVGES